MNILPLGFKTSGIRCGLKEKGKDLGLILSEIPAVCSCAITKNRLKSPSVVLTKQNIAKNKISAVIVNSGCANCATKTAKQDAEKVIEELAKYINTKPNNIAIAQTGVIGKKLNVQKIINSLPLLIKNLKQETSDFSEAILTTDKIKKEIFSEVLIDDKKITIYGVCKGSGMIAPNLSTMLVFILTDIVITKKMLNTALKYCVNKTFNLITVDGDTSPNDNVIILANGLSKNKIIKTKDLNFRIFREVLYDVCLNLAKQIVKDGEGATKLVEIEVCNAKNINQAKKIGSAIANSPLVKCAIFGSDPNWGRILSAVGNSQTDVNIENVDIYFDNLKIVEQGCGSEFDVELARKILSGDFKITVDVKSGNKSVKIYTCDFSYDYVKINAEYHT